jgi:hypothetical protein
MFGTIVVGIDHTSVAGGVLAAVARLAAATGDKVVPMHVRAMYSGGKTGPMVPEPRCGRPG